VTRGEGGRQRPHLRRQCGGGGGGGGGGDGWNEG
jgi:hypothetical protein